jgi:hypothetical protein
MGDSLEPSDASFRAKSGAAKAKDESFAFRRRRFERKGGPKKRPGASLDVRDGLMKRPDVSLDARDGLMSGSARRSAGRMAS